MTFDLNATGFSKGNAQFCVMASALAYKEPAEIEAALTPLGFTRFVHLNDARTDTQGFIAFFETFIQVAFRGTESIRDWLTDGRIKMVSCDGFLVHSGFAECFQAVDPILFDTLAKWDYPIVFSGHSLGGALAAVAAAKYALNRSNPVYLYTFGQPRVGERFFAEWLNKVTSCRYFRIVNEVDIVPRLPWCLGKYVHAGTEIYLDECGRIDTNPPLYWKLAMDCLSAYRDYHAKRLGFLHDHFIANYELRLA